ncbi:hypothetical protein [Gloeothece verrucosa]|uniref:TIR domain-containing protein n=1 Tax=Gloeothece verrucosa (strain PCC 7822) TaxID=497965 RepID=E0UEL9_GLOV7|nr:hypothetical protein [Gloeothece verrucosa]ADN16587.1 hypothetical protein Cyan7822_4682 [Gloeothece verrucosa PCC 7822]
MSATSSPQIFICYAHNDNESLDPSKRWLDRLLEQLEPLQLNDQADIWSDQRIELGTDWHDEIQITLQKVSAAVLRVRSKPVGHPVKRSPENPWVKFLSAKYGCAHSYSEIRALRSGTLRRQGVKSLSLRQSN